MVSKAWNDLHQKRNNDHLLFGSRDTTIDIPSLHPEQIHIFKLWQVYLDNVNPLLKVTHTPTLQARIIEAASNMADVNPTLAALMLGIYCVAILSVGEEECYTMFGTSRACLLTKYQFGCQQALISCGFLRSTDCDCLTALYLYLVSLLGCRFRAGLMLPDLNKIRNRSSVSFLYARSRNTYCATPGAQPRVC